MDLQEFMFPVATREVAVNDGTNDLTFWTDAGTYLRNDYKAIVRADTNEVISVVRKSYKIVSNQTLIENLLFELTRTDTPYLIDQSHSFVANERMRLQVTFPELRMSDGESDIALSLFLHNSYDMSEGIRMFWGAIRKICTNGMVFGKVLAKFYHRHTRGFSIHNLRTTLLQTCDTLPAIQQRILELDSQIVTDEVRQSVSKELGKTIAKQVLRNSEISQWALYNLITYFISHAIDQRRRAHYQMATARVFGL